MNLAAILFLEEEILLKNQRVRERVLARSIAMGSENFTRVSGEDIRNLFEEIDQEYFQGELMKALREKTALPMIFRFSKRSTRSGGTTFMHRRRAGLAGGFRPSVQFEIAISSRLLFLNYDGTGRPISVGGKPCATRLEAMQRIMEHEMMHLWEFVLYGKSSCRGSRFKTLIGRIFGHTESAHRLITPTEKAMETHQVRPGQMVEFEFGGKRIVGMVNRINRRATVLVESERGQPYRNGKRYLKYYVPLGGVKGM